MCFTYQDGVFKRRPLDEELGHPSDNVRLAQDEERGRAGALLGVVGGVGPARHRGRTAHVAHSATGCRHGRQLSGHERCRGCRFWDRHPESNNFLTVRSGVLDRRAFKSCQHKLTLF